jgi:hypothetical protein
MEFTWPLGEEQQALEVKMEAEEKEKTEKEQEEQEEQEEPPDN